MDVMAEVFRAIRLEGAIYFNGELSSPWCVTNPGADQIEGFLSKKNGHVVIFHTILGGRALVRLPDGRQQEVSPGSIVIFPHGGPTPKPDAADGITLAGAGRHEMTRVVCGYLICDARLGQLLLSSLPQLMIVPIKQGTSGDWIQHSIQFLVTQKPESDPSREVVLFKLAEVLLLETLRQYIHDLPPDHESWLAGVRDPFVGKALAELHNRPERPWTLVTLGREVGLSRTRLAERFTKFVGRPPMTYLSEWRLKLGAQLLGSGNSTVAEIASRVGYASEASFCRAFKKEFGAPPARFRRTASSGT